MAAHPVGPCIDLRLAPHVLAQVDSLAAARRTTRSAVLRDLIDAGMELAVTEEDGR
jgi:predicted transcriptional regulator